MKNTISTNKNREFTKYLMQFIQFSMQTIEMSSETEVEVTSDESGKLNIRRITPNFGQCEISPDAQRLFPSGFKTFAEFDSPAIYSPRMLLNF